MTAHDGNAACARNVVDAETVALDERYSLWADRAQEQLDLADRLLSSPDATSDDVLAALGLSQLAYRIAIGDTTPESWPVAVDPECICPPELVARGGFKGGCPAHANV